MRGDRTGGIKGRQEKEKRVREELNVGRDGVGSLMGVGSLLKFWGPERLPPSKIEKPIKSHGLSIGISHQIDPTPKGREGGGGRRETGPAAPREGRSGGREGERAGDRTGGSGG